MAKDEKATAKKIKATQVAEKKAKDLLEARAVMGDLLLKEKQYQSALQQLVRQINQSIMKVQELSKE